MRRSAKILILNKEGIIEKISYERRAYESVDEKSLCPEKRRKKEFMHLRVNLTLLYFFLEVFFGCISKGTQAYVLYFHLRIHLFIYKNTELDTFFSTIITVTRAHCRRLLFTISCADSAMRGLLFLFNFCELEGGQTTSESVLCFFLHGTTKIMFKFPAILMAEKY